MWLHDPAFQRCEQSIYAPLQIFRLITLHVQNGHFPFIGYAVIIVEDEKNMGYPHESANSFPI